MAASAAVLAVVGVFVTRANMRFITPTTVMYHTADGYHTASLLLTQVTTLLLLPPAHLSGLRSLEQVVYPQQTIL